MASQISCIACSNTLLIRTYCTEQSFFGGGLAHVGCICDKRKEIKMRGKESKLHLGWHRSWQQDSFARAGYMLWPFVPEESMCMQRCQSIVIT